MISAFFSPSGSIRRRLFFLLVGMSLGTLILANLIWLPSAIQEIRQSQDELRRIAVQFTRDQIEEQIKEREFEMTAIARRFRTYLIDGDREALHNVAQVFLQSEHAFEEVGIIDEEGKELVRFSRRSAITDRDLVDRSGTPLFRDGMKQEMYWDRVIITETSEPWVTLAIRLPHSSGLSGKLVFGVINLKGLWKLMEEFKLSHEGRAYIVDDTGRLIAAADPSNVLRQLSFADRPLIQRLIHPKNSDDRPFVESDYTNEKGVDVVATGLLLARPRWGLVVEQSRSLLFGPIRQKIWFFSSVTLAGLFLSFVLARTLSRLFTRPILQLREGAEQVGGGNLEHRIAIETNDEIGELGFQFNRMAAELRASYQGLENKVAERTRDISALYAAMGPLVSTESGELLEQVMERLKEATQADAALIRLFDRTTKSYLYPASTGFPASYLEATRIVAPDSAIGNSFMSGEPIIAASIRGDPRLKGKTQLNAGFTSCAFLPLRFSGEPRGIVHLASRELGHFNEGKKDQLMAIVRQMGVAMENSELYETVRKKAEELQHKTVELERANKAKDEFLGVMSHELRTPLNAVIGYSALLKDGVLGEVNAQQQEALGKMLARANDQLKMINSILETTQIGAGAVSAVCQEANLNELLDEIRSAYVLPTNKETTLHWQYSSKFPVVAVDREKLKHILQNIINNAIKFTEKGSITVSVRHLAKPAVLELKVTDTGVGIPKAMLPSIFEMFRQVDSSERRQFGGVGLGLYIVKQLTDLLGGSVEVESEEGKGSTFLVTLPCALAADEVADGIQPMAAQTTSANGFFD